MNKYYYLQFVTKINVDFGQNKHTCIVVSDTLVPVHGSSVAKAGGCPLTPELAK